MTDPRYSAALILLLAFSALSAAAIFLGLGLGECLPRDGSPEMHLCDHQKLIDVIGFPALVVSAWVATAIFGRGRPWTTGIAFLAVPFLALLIIRLLSIFPA
jgi:hypothetical protein